MLPNSTADGLRLSFAVMGASTVALSTMLLARWFMSLGCFLLGVCQR